MRRKKKTEEAEARGGAKAAGAGNEVEAAYFCARSRVLSMARRGDGKYT